MLGQHFGAKLVKVASDRWEEYDLPKDWQVVAVSIEDDTGYILITGPVAM